MSSGEMAPVRSLKREEGSLMGTGIRRVTRSVAILAVLMGILGLGAATAQADDAPVSNPGTAEATVTGGSLKLGALNPIPLSDFGASSITADVAADGSVAVSAADFDFPGQAPAVISVGGNDVNVLLSLVATGDGSGTIDPDGGSLSLAIPVKIGIEGVTPDLGPDCAVGPIELSLSSSDYDQETGTATLGDASFTVPAAANCEPIGGVIDFNNAFNTQAQLPAAAGASNVSAAIDLAGQAPLGQIHAEFGVDKASGTGPLQVNFNAGASRSRIVSYTWDFGDGSDPVVESAPTTQHVYDEVGSFTPSLTVARADSSTDSFALAEPIEVSGAVTSIDAKPEGLSNVTDPTFEFSSDLNPASFECSLDGAAFAACESPLQLADLADGDHDFSVRAIHDGVTGLATSYEFSVDTVKPVTTIDAAPAQVNGPDVDSGEIEFSANELGLDFECSYDGAQFAPCVSPVEVEWDQADSNHSFKVKSIDELGNESEPAIATWRMDVTAPETTITESPASPNGHYDDPRAGFEFASNESGTFVCQFNDGEERPCAPGVQAGTGDQGGQDRLGQPVEGTNGFKVWAVDEAGNRDPAPATASYQFIGQQPQITVLNGPQEFTTYRDANIVFQSENQDVTKFQCRDLAQGTAWADCDPGNINARTGRWVATDLGDGEHTLEVRGVNAIGTESKAENIGTYTWTIDRTAPFVEIVGGPTRGGYTNETDATFEFDGNEEGISFECRVDSPGWNPCPSPHALSGLSAGTHTIEIRGTDRAGIASSNTDSWSWHVGQSEIDITGKPAALSPVASAAFEFASSPAAGQYECRLDPNAGQNDNDTGWVNCASGVSYGSLSDGPHRFEVRGDGGFPAIYTWVVSTAGPVPDVTGAPAGFSGLAQNSASIEFSAEDPNGPVTEFECRFQEVGSPAQPWDACTSPQNVSWDENADGTSMRFEVRAISPAGNVGPESITEWKIISTKPTVAIGGAVAGWDGTDQTGGVATADSDRPAPLTTVSAPQFRFTSSAVYHGGFACQLNDGEVVFPCGTGVNPGQVIISDSGADALGENPVEGENTLNVWAVDAGGNQSDDADSYTWTQDTTAPTITFTSENPSVTNSDDLHVTFTSDQAVRPVGGFKCRVDGAPGSDDPEDWADCDEMVDPETGAWVGAGLIKGQHTLDVKGIDPLGNRILTGNGLRYKFTIDRNAPSSQITSAPSGTVVEDSATVEFTGSAVSGIARFECSLDSGTWSTCSSPAQFTGLADGSHTVEVRAVDRAGNVEDSPSSASWSVDSTKPVVSLSDDLTLTGGATAADHAEFTFSVTPGGSDLSCRLIAPGQTPGVVAWTACSSPRAYTGLADGSYQFQVKAVNDLGTESDVVSRSWSIDTVAPVATIASAPSGTVNADSASVGFSADDPGAIFACQLDDGEVENPCASPVVYSDLADGEHTVKVIAADALGNVGPAAEASWTVDTTAPSVTITSNAIGETEATEASFEFESDDSGASFECSLDSADFSSCSSPQKYTGLAVGQHKVEIRATDAVGNVSALASESWTVKEVKKPVCPEGQVGVPPNCQTPVEPTADLARLTLKTPKKVKSGKKFAVKASITNNGDGDAANVKVCVKTQKRLIAGGAKRCRTIKKIAAGSTAMITFKLKAKKAPKKAKKKRKTKVVVSAPTGAAAAGGPTGQRVRWPVILK